MRSYHGELRILTRNFEIGTSETLTVTRIFTSYSYLTLLCSPLNNIIQLVPTVLAAVACFERIQDFLDRDNRDDFRDSPTIVASSKGGGLDDLNTLSKDSGQVPMVSISRGNFGWEHNADSLTDINLNIPKGQLSMVVGPIASGKSTLCRVILGEAIMSDGLLTLASKSRRIGYCDQKPFLTNETIRRNILGFSSYDSHRYKTVIEATMLAADLMKLPQGDETRIGSNGLSLSGGQKQRVSMARALYLETDFFVFDDVLSGLDADTEDQVFQRVFGPEGVIRKRGATAILCTHSIKHLPSADHIIAISSGGRIVEQGTFNQLLTNESYVHSLGIRSHVATAAKLQESVDASTPEAVVRADFVTEYGTPALEEIAARIVSRDRTVYKHYYQSVGFWPVIAFLLTALVEGFFYNWQTIWIDFWSIGIATVPPSHSNDFYLGLFALFQTLGLIFLPLNVWICLGWILPRSGSSLHKAALNTVIEAPLHFFTTTDIGSVTNLFSQDISLIDGELPTALINTTLGLTMASGMAIVIAVSTPYLMITYPILIMVLWTIQRFYLRTSRQLRILDLEAKSPL